MYSSLSLFHKRNNRCGWLNLCSFLCCFVSGLLRPIIYYRSTISKFSFFKNFLPHSQMIWVSVMRVITLVILSWQIYGFPLKNPFSKSPEMWQYFPIKFPFTSFAFILLILDDLCCQSLFNEWHIVIYKWKYLIMMFGVFVA